jgi:transposase-like protein
LVRETVRVVFQELIEAELAEQIGAGRHHGRPRCSPRTATRENGWASRQIPSSPSPRSTG